MKEWFFAMKFPQVGQKGFARENYVGYYSFTKDVGILAISCWLSPI